MPRDDKEDLIGFEVTEIPRSYVEYDKTSEVNQLSSWNVKKTNLQFQRFLRSVLHADIRFAFRIESSRGNRRLLYLLYKKDTKMFEPIYMAHFQDFNLQPVKLQSIIESKSGRYENKNEGAWSSLENNETTSASLA